MGKLIFGSDWRTSLAGIATAAAFYAQNSGVQIVNWKSAAVSLGLYAVGRLSSDATKGQSETKAKQ